MTGGAPPTVDVIYIAFGDYGLEPVGRFLSSYLRHPAGHPHRLVIAMKGEWPAEGRAAVLEASVSARAHVIDVPDGGFDIGTFAHLALASTAERLCLFNSNAELLGDAWLLKLVDAHVEQGGGAVAATGSWESAASDHLVYRPEWPRSIATRLWFTRRMLRHFAAYPNPHLRTNAILLDRDEFLRVANRNPSTKDDAWRIESGRAGLSATLRRAGKPIRVVGRDGRAYAPETWNRSETFWQGEQANLLVADNQTRRYADADDRLRRVLCANAWRRPRLLGRRSDPRSGDAS